MKKLYFSTFAIAALLGTASAQPAKLAWTRTNLSTDLIQDTVSDALVSSNGRFLIVGDYKEGGHNTGIVTILNRNRSVHDVWTGIWGDSSSCSECVESGGYFYVAGNLNPTGSANQQIFIVKLDQNLNNVYEWVFSATTAGGMEVPTDLEVDAAGNVYVCGWGENGTERNTWLYKATMGDALLEFQIPEKYRGTQEPMMALPEVGDEVFIAMLNNKNPELNRFLSDGTRTWTQAQLADNQFTSAEGRSMSFELMFDNFSAPLPTVRWSGTWNSTVGVGMYQSRAATRRINRSTGNIEESLLYTPEPGTNMIMGVDDWMNQSASAVGFRRGNRSEVNLLSGLNITSTWQSPANQVIRGLSVHRDIFGETSIMTARDAGSGMATGFTKLNAAGAKRWDIFLPVTLGYTHVDWGIVSHEASGDILGIESSATGFRLSCINQASVAISDTFRPRSGITFRPPLPVTTNDRWAGGASISVTQQPLHGTLTMGATGSFLYKSVNGFVGTDTFTYTLTKPGLSPSTATVNLIVRL